MFAVFVQGNSAQGKQPGISCGLGDDMTLLHDIRFSLRSLRLAVAIFVTDAHADQATCEAVIARIAQAIYGSAVAKAR